MKKIGIVLILVWPLLIAGFGLHAYFASRWYYSSAMISRNDATNEDMNRAWAEVSPKPSDVTFEPVSNTDLFEVKTRSLDSHTSVDTVNTLAAAIVQRLHGKGGIAAATVMTAEPSTYPSVSYPLLPNLLVGVVLGIFPAIVGVILLLLGQKRTSPVYATAQGA